MFNRLVERNPWVKLYVAAIPLIESVGCYLYATSKDIDVTELLDRIGLFGIFGAIMLVFLPFIIIRLGEVYGNTEP